MQLSQRSLPRGINATCAIHKAPAQFPLACVFALLIVQSILFREAHAQSSAIPNTATMGQALSANITGNYTSPPTVFPTSVVTDAAVAGNGDMAIILGGTPSALKFDVGKADFFGVLHGQVQPVGSLLLSAPSLSGSPYSVKQNVGQATITGSFVNGSYGLSMGSWVASSENTAVIQLTNTGSQPLSLSSTLTEGFEGTTGNPGTYGATNNSTWLYVSPDTVNIELGNQLYNADGSSPFTGAIADFKLFTNALSPSTIANLDATNAPTPVLQWQGTNNGVATLVGSGVSINAGDIHGGSVLQTSGGNGELLVGDIPFPEHQFTLSTWFIPTATGQNSTIVAAQIPYTDIYGSTFPYPYVRGLSLNLVNGALSATLNESGYLNLSSPYLTFYPDAVNKYTTTAGSPVPYGTWEQASVTYDGNVMTLYINGVQVGTPVTFPTGTNGMYGYNKMAVHIGDTNLTYNGCAPVGTMMQSVLGATTTTNSQGTLSFTIPAGGQASIVLAAVTDRNNTNYFSAAQQQSMQATASSLTTLRQTHDAFWSNFWSKSFVQIPDQKIQDSWYASLYLLACCSGTNSPAPGLWGNFITSEQTSWNGDYTLDYNYEAPFYAGLANNHMELATNYEAPLIDQMPRGEQTAQYLLGMTNSIYFYCHMIPSPGWGDDPGSFWGQKSDALFAATDIAQHWKYTLDTNYAAKVYPFLKEVANFWDNYLVYTNGVYVDYNDSVAEQTGPDTHPATTVAFLQLLLPTVVQMSQALNVDATNRPLWTNIIANLLPISIVPASSIGSIYSLGAPYDNPGVNVIQDCLSGTQFPTPEVTVYQDHQIRGSSPGMNSTQVIFPGWLVGLESPASTIKAATNTIWIAAEWFDGNDDCTFYPSAASVGYDPNAILSNLDTLITYYRYNNFMFNTEGGGTEDFSIIPSTLAAMFLQSYQTNIHVFPDWPTNQSAAFGNLNACGGFLVSSAITLGKPNYIQIQSTAGQMLKLANPWTNSSVQCVSSIKGTTNLSGAVLDYQTQVGEVLTLTTTNPVLNAPTNVGSSTNSGAVVLNWNPVSGAEGYNIKRSTSPNGPFVTLASVTSGTGYTDTSANYNTTYYYQITALEPGYESTNATTLSVTTGGKPPVLNASFESQSVSQGSYLIGDPTDWSSSLFSGTADAVISPGPIGSGEPWPTIPVPGLDGTNFCQIYATAAGGGGTVYQDTGLKYVPGATYTLTAAFGLQTYQTFDTGSSFGFYNSTLTPVASTTITSSNLVSSSFKDTTLTYTGTGNEGGNGDIIVAFYAPPAAAAGTYLDFDNVRLSVSNPVAPSIATQPVSKSTNAGSSVSFTVVATGTSPLSYQWYANTNSLIAGATNATLTLNNVESSATYDVVVSNSAGSITSSIVNLTVQLSTNPVSIPIVNNTFSAQSVSSGSYLNLQTGGPTGWSASGVSSAVVALVNPSETDGRGFTNIPVPGLNGPNYCQIFAYQGGGTGIVYQDTGIQYVAGVTYNFTAVFGLENGAFPTGATMAFYNSNLTPIASQTISSNNLTLGAFTSQTLGYTATGSEGGNGDIIIGFNLPSTAGTASFDFGNVTLTQASAAAPVINVQPVSQAVYSGQSTSFSVSAYGSLPFGYQWQAGPAGGPYTNLVNGGQISGVNSNVLTISNASTNLALAYQVVITNAYGSVTSAPTATLSFLPGTLLSISNPGFDSDAITGANAPGYEITTPSGWTVSGTNSSSYIGLINPTGLGVYSSTNGYSVPNALESYSGDGVANPTVSQVLTNTLQANTTYTVSVQVGNRTSGTWGGYHILLETTNGTLVGDWVGVINAAAPVGNVAAVGTFATTYRSFTTGANPPGLGQQLKIVLSQGAPTPGSYNDFDNVSVVAKPSTGHASGTPIDVFISAGQSNDQGAYAFVPDLSQANLHYANSPDSRALFAYKHAQYNATSWNTGSMGQLSPDGAGHGENLPGFGPELPVGTDLAVRFGKPLAMIKFAAGGANLDTQFQKSANFLYPMMITEITNSLQQLTAQGYIPTVRGFFWLQGEADATANPTTYTNDIANFVADVRTDLQVPKLEFVLTQVNSNMPAFANYQTGVAEVNAAMTTLANSDPNVKFVTTDDMTSGFGDGSVHYSADQIVTIGQRWAAAYSPQIPFITTQPVAISTNAGSAASFTVVASGSSPLSYQWYFDTNIPISGATNATLSLTNVQSSGTYDVVVSNAYGSLTSSIARLTVLPNAPASLTATPGVNAVTLSYPAVTSAKYYIIYRSKTSGGRYTKMATTTSTRYIDRNVVAGITYYYVVVACDGYNISSYSVQASATPHR